MITASAERLRDEIRRLLDALRHSAAGRYACVMEPDRIVFESQSEPQRELSGFLRERGEQVFAIPRRLADDDAMDDVFEAWDDDEFFLAVINGRVAVVVACPDAEALRERAMRPLRALADRLFRYEPSYRVDEKGRGFFFGRPRLDLVVIGGRSQG
jgi:hypothetical protein